jgi:hypothetical protein
MLNLILATLAATAAPAAGNTISCGTIQKLKPATFAQSAAHNYLGQLSSTEVAKAIYHADQDFAAEYLQEAQKVCGSSESANQTAKRLDDSLTAASLSASNSQCKSYLAVAKGLGKAERVLKSPIAKINLFLTQFPQRAAKAAKKNSEALQQLQRKNPGLMDANQLSQEAGKFFLGKIPGYSDGLNLNLYQSLWQQRTEACAAMKKMMDSEMLMRRRYYACGDKAGANAYDQGGCYQDVAAGQYDPDWFSSMPSNSGTPKYTAWTTSTDTTWMTDMSTSVSTSAGWTTITSTSTAWTTMTVTDTTISYEDSTPRCAYVAPQEYYDLCGAIR